MNISMPQYNFHQLVIALNESIQLEREIDKESKSSKAYHGQFTINPKQVRDYDSSHRSNSKIMEISEHKDTSILLNRIKEIRKTSHDRLFISRDTTHVTEAQAESETIHAIFFDRSRSKSCFLFVNRRLCWNNEYPRTNSSSRKMSFIECGSSQHILADRKGTPSLRQIKTNLMSHNLLHIKPNQ